MAACPVCTASVVDGAARCPSCDLPFTSARPATDIGHRGPRPMIPAPPQTLGAAPPTPLAAQLPPQPAQSAQSARPAGPAPTTTEPPAPYSLGAGPVTGLTPVAPERSPWWRDLRVLAGVPATLVVLVVGWLLLTTGDVERVVVPVPSVVGTDSLDAKTALERAGFVVPFAGTGTVTGQDPASGAEAAPGTAVVLSVRPYPEPPAPAPAPTGSRAPTTPSG